MFSEKLLEEKRHRVYSTALTLLKQGKSVSTEQIYESLHAFSDYSPRDVVQSLRQLFERVGAGLQPVQLHQAFLFAKAAVGHWKSEYSVLIVQGRKNEETVYHIYGVVGPHPASAHAYAHSTREVLGHLEAQGIRIADWYPLPDYQQFL